MQLAVRDVARLLGVSEKTIYRWINSRTIPAYLLNGQYRFNRSQILEWASARKLKITPDILREPESKNTVLPCLSEAIEAGGVFYRVGGHDQASALRALVEIMRLPEEVDREFLFEVLLARESYASTGIGNGIAMPHARNPVVEHLLSPTVTLCFLENPVDFDALDGQPVSVLVCPVSPTIRAHLHLMGRLLFALRDQAFQEVIHRAASRTEILEECRRVDDGLVAGEKSSRVARLRPGSDTGSTL